MIIAYTAFLAIPLAVYIPIWRAPIVTKESFQQGLSAHPELLGKKVRVRAKIKHSAITCICSVNDKTSCKVAAMLLDLGKGKSVY